MNPQRFDGFSPAAVAFFDGIAADNSKAYWNDHREVYDDQIRAPMTALLAELADEFGAAKIFRPYRDVRFSTDKSPYKDHLGAFTGPSPTRDGSGAGLYLQLSGSGLYAGGGCYSFDREALARYRSAVDATDGSDLVSLLDELRAAGFAIGGESLVRAPRGFDPDHPRIDLLRHKGVHAARDFGTPDWLFTAEARERVAGTWRGLAALNAWLDRHVTTP